MGTLSSFSAVGVGAGALLPGVFTLLAVLLPTCQPLISRALIVSVSVCLYSDSRPSHPLGLTINISINTAIIISPGHSLTHWLVDGRQSSLTYSLTS